VLGFILMLSVSLFYGLGVQLTGASEASAIFIKEDGSVEGTDKIQRDGNVYLLVADLSGAIRAMDVLITIEKDGVVFDGGDRTIQGTGSGVAIAAYGRKDVTIKNTRIINFGVGINLRATDFERNVTASNNKILDNYIDTTYFAIDLNTISGTVAGNTLVSRNSKYGVLFDCNSTVFSDNSFVDGGLIVYQPLVGNVLYGNTINGKSLVYLEGQSDQVIDGAAQVILTDCSGMIVRNVDTTADLRVTITLFGTSNTVITNCRGNVVLKGSHSNMIFDNYLVDVGSWVSYRSAAIELSGSDNNTIAGNSILATGSLGMSLFGSSYNSVKDNQISSSGQAGVIIESTVDSTSVFNYIHENSISCTEYGIYFRHGARNNFIFKNSIEDCKNAVMLSSGHENTFVGNNISRSMQYAVYFAISDDNIFYHNNFIDNAVQAFEQHEFHVFPGPFTYYSDRNMWDSGEEGNYWSDYTGYDADGDGIGETPYHVYGNFTDRYPLTTPFDINRVNIIPETLTPPLSPEPTPPTQPPSSEPSPTAESFPAFLVITIIFVIVVVVAGLLIFFRRKEKSKVRQPS
jgi:parallel beta-helix repeat protein